MYERYETSPFYLTLTHPSVEIQNKIHIRQRSMRTLGKDTKKHFKDWIYSFREKMVSA